MSCYADELKLFGGIDSADWTVLCILVTPEPTQDWSATSSRSMRSHAKWSLNAGHVIPGLGRLGRTV